MEGSFGEFQSLQKSLLGEGSWVVKRGRRFIASVTKKASVGGIPWPPGDLPDRTFGERPSGGSPGLQGITRTRSPLGIIHWGDPPAPGGSPGPLGSVSGGDP